MAVVQAVNAFVIFLCGAACLVRDLVPVDSRADDSVEIAGNSISVISGIPGPNSPDAETTIIDDGNALRLEDLAPEIDAVPPEEFAQRAARVGIFSENQIQVLKELIVTHEQLSLALRHAVAQKTLTVYQALHLLWGKEDRLRIGQFVVTNVLGVGGMSVVYRAQKLGGGAEIALKVVPKATRHEARFRREMQLAQLLAHPNIVVAHEVGETGDRYFIAMELVTGRNLQDVVRLHGSLSEAVALQYILQAARGLEHAHERGVIHRDVKPGNLLLCRDGTVKVADLGLSQETGDVDLGNSKGAVSGTVDFMAPEQASPQTKSVAQIDVYGLGTTLFYLLTGKPHVKGETTHEKLVNLTVSRRFHRLPSGSAKAKTMNLLRRMTAWDVAARTPSMTDVITEVEGILQEMGREHAPQSLHVLVVEDDPAQMYLTARLLTRTNRSIDVSKCDRLQTAIDTYHEHSVSTCPVDLVLLDLNLPDSTGADSLIKFKAEHPDAAVIVLSGNVSPELESECLLAGAAAYVCKSDLNLGSLERSLFRIQSEIRNKAAPV